MNSPSWPDRRAGSQAGLFGLVGVLAAEVALVAALHLVGGPDSAVPLRSLGDWLQSADPTVALVALARLAGLVIGYWLLLSTLAYAGAHLLGWQRVTEALRWVTLPVIRRAVQGVTALSLTSASLLGPAAISIAPALAETTEQVAQDDSTETDDGGTTGSDNGEAGNGNGEDDYDVDAAGWPDVGADGEFWRPSIVSQAQTSGDYTVVSQDHFWSIAETHLRQAVGRDVTEDEICQYWVRVVDANRARIRSGDPDLIYPQESLVLPPVFDGS